MFGLGAPELVVIIIAVVILFFGSNKVNDLARGAGRFSGEYKKGKAEIEKELKEMSDESEEKSNSKKK